MIDVMDDTHIEGSLPGYVLGSLADEEVLRVVAHLAVCPYCHSQFRRYKDLMGYLAFAAPDAEPASDVKRRLMQRIENHREPEVAASSPCAVSVQYDDMIVKCFQGLRSARTILSFVLMLVLSISAVTLWQQVMD